VTGSARQAPDPVAVPATRAQTAVNLPDKPVILIKPGTSWPAPDLREAWASRELLYFLTWRDVKIRYKQTFLGVAWAVLQPALTMIVFAFIFGRVAHVPSNDIPYPIFAYAGLVPWLFLANGVANGGNSVVASSHLITKVYFPRMLVPASAVGAAFVDFVIASMLLVPLALWYQIDVGIGLLLIPLLIILLLLLTLALGMWLSALNVKYRDFRYVIPFALQIGMYVSPVAYPVSAVPAKWRILYAFNPATGVLEGFRSALFGQTVDWRTLGISAISTIALLIGASIVFTRAEKSFADIL
jgi:lipopolysaccharide transport system permease protein